MAVGMFSAATVFAQAAAPAQPAAPSPFVFKGDGGVILNFVKADKTADFEMVMGKLKEALAKSEKPERKAQAAGWKYFKADEPGPNGAVIYVFIMDPVAQGQEYSVGTSWSRCSARPKVRPFTRPTPTRTPTPRSARCCT
jgi:hypothetical protein